MELTPRNVLITGAIGAVALFGVDRFIQYEAQQAGQVAGEAAREEVEEIDTDIADAQWARLQELLGDEDLRALIIQELEADGITDVADIITALEERDAP